jgi:hypothetical protein
MTEKIAFKLRTEIRPKLNPADFNIKSIFKRLEKKGDLWEGLDDQNIKEKNTSILTKLLCKSSFDPEEPYAKKRLIRGGSFLCNDSYLLWLPGCKTNEN